MATSAATMASILANMRMPEGVNPVVVSLPNPPALRGALSPNNWLTRAQAYAVNLVNGPESLVVVNRYVYTGLKDGWVVEIKPNGVVRKILRMSIRSCGRPRATEDACGRPLGIRADRQGYLVVADAYNGIFRINPSTGNFRQLVDARNHEVNGKPLQYINDLAVARDGTVFFTSSSTKWLPSQLLNILFEGETSGRVLVYNPREILAARRVQELVSNLHYPNGLQLSPKEDYLLIGEGGRSRIHRAWIGKNSPNFGKIDVFASNLPGFVDNIRLSPRGTYWVGLSRARHQNLPSVLDTYGNNPKVRANLISLVNNKMIFDDPHFGIVVELDMDGQIVRSLQDPTGNKYTSVSEVAEENGLLFIASKRKNFIGIINLRTLPKPAPEIPPGLDGGPGSHVVDLSSIADPNLRALLTRVKQRLTKFSDRQVRSVVLVLVKRLFEAKMQARRAMMEVTRLRSDLERLQEMIGQSGSGTGVVLGGGGGGDGGTGAGGGTTGAGDQSPSTSVSTTPVDALNSTVTDGQVMNTTTSAPTTVDPGSVVGGPDSMGGGGMVGGSVDMGSSGGSETTTTSSSSSSSLSSSSETPGTPSTTDVTVTSSTEGETTTVAATI